MSILEIFEKILFNYNNLNEIKSAMQREIKLEKKTNQIRKQYSKLLKYVCIKCGAFNHVDQGFCGICKTSNLRKATKIDIDQALAIVHEHQIYF